MVSFPCLSWVPSSDGAFLRVAPLQEGAHLELTEIAGVYGDPRAIHDALVTSGRRGRVMLGSWQEARMNRREHRERRDFTENVRVLKDGLQRLVNGFAG